MSNIPPFGSPPFNPASDTIHVLKAGDTMTGALNINGSANAKQLVVKANGTQTNDLQQWQDSAGTVGSGVTADGYLHYVGGPSPSGSTASVSIGRVSGYGGLWIGAAVPAINNYLLLYSGGQGPIFGAKSGEYIQYRVNNATYFTVGANGAVCAAIDNTNPTSTQQYLVQPSSSSKIGEVIKGAASQSADLTQWQDSSSNVLAKVDKSGNITAPNLVTILSTTTGIDAKSVAATTLYTVPTGKTAIITQAIVRCTAASSITNGPTLGIGIASGEDDIYALTNLAALTTTTSIFGFSTVGMSRNAVATSVIKLGVDVAATGTSETISCDLIGYLL